MWTIATILLILLAGRFILYVMQWAAYKDLHNRFYDGTPKAWRPDLKKPTLLNIKKRKK